MKGIKKILELFNKLIDFVDITIAKQKKILIIIILIVNFLVLSFVDVHWIVQVLLLTFSWFFIREL